MAFKPFDFEVDAKRVQTLANKALGNKVIKVDTNINAKNAQAPAKKVDADSTKVK